MRIKADRVETLAFREKTTNKLILITSPEVTRVKVDSDCDLDYFLYAGERYDDHDLLDVVYDMYTKTASEVEATPIDFYEPHKFKIGEAFRSYDRLLTRVEIVAANYEFKHKIVIKGSEVKYYLYNFDYKSLDQNGWYAINYYNSVYTLADGTIIDSNMAYNVY